jgi:hypothetical protein
VKRLTETQLGLLRAIHDAESIPKEAVARTFNILLENGLLFMGRHGIHLTAEAYRLLGEPQPFDWRPYRGEG